MLGVWAHNASQWGDDSTQVDQIPFHQTAITREFLSDKDERFFVCGLKGIGKTLLLQKKSLKMRQEQSGVVFLPAGQPVERLSPFVYSMSEVDAKDLSVQTGWFRVWQFALALSIVKRLTEAGVLAGSTISPRLEDAFAASAASVSYHVDALLRLGPHERRRLIESETEALLAVLRKLHSGVVVFVDAIDDCVYSHMGPDLARYEERTKTDLGVLSSKVWRAAQVGFVRAAVALHESNRHIKIFGALRKEALDGDITPDRQNIEAYLINLEYTRGDLKGIFRTKLQALRGQDPKCFMDVRSSDVVAAFLGFTQLSHPTAKTMQWEPREEDVLDYIIRHTRGRPRELDLVGLSLQYMSAPRLPDSVRRVVHEKSKEWFDWARSEMIPYWRTQYDELVRALPSNVISRSDMNDILRELGWSEAAPTSLKDLFELGLIGCVSSGDGGVGTQRFRQNDPELPVTLELFEASTHYVVHPCVNLATRELKTRYEADVHNIVGHGYPFASRGRRLHVHFGLGALGIGLVLPILAKAPGTSVAVVQRLSPRWALARGWKGRVRLSRRVRGHGGELSSLEQVAEMRAHVGGRRRATLDQTIEWWESGKGHVTLVTNEKVAVRRLLGRASSVSTSLRDRESLIQAAHMVVKFGRGSVDCVYPFENDEGVVEEMREILDAANIALVRVSADRICRKADVGQSGVVVETEDYYRVVVNSDAVDTKALFSSADVDERHAVVFEPDPRRFQWEREAKRLLVNGGHFAYVVYVCRRLNRLYPDRWDLVKLLIDKPVSELLFSQDVRDALSQIGDLYVAHLLVKAELDGLVANSADVESLFAHLMKSRDTFGERVASTRDEVARILRPHATTINERVRRFTSCLEDLGGRVRRTKFTQRFYLARGVNLDGLQRDAAGFTGACVELFAYIAANNDA